MRKLVVLVALLGVAGCVDAGAAWANSVTPMCTTAQGGPSPCNDGWYTTVVQVSWAVSPLPQTESQACLQTATFTADANLTIECDATWSSPPDIQYPYEVRVEISSPTATATLARPPDSNGWYNHPVAVSFSGSAFSGIASCTPATTYGGPSAANATVSGSCTDNAGKIANASLPLNYDDAPPTITGAVPSRPPDAGGYYTRPVSFRFTGIDAGSGIAGCDTVTYSGPGSGSVVGGCHDRAGNYATLSMPVRYRRTAPTATVTRVRSSMLLSWRKASRASYYNVQIFRAGKKILSVWPSRTSLTLRRSWSFAGRRFTLKSGRYHWYVWPGFGSRTSAHYGRMLVSSTFRVGKLR